MFQCDAYSMCVKGTLFLRKQKVSSQKYRAKPEDHVGHLIQRTVDKRVHSSTVLAAGVGVTVGKGIANLK